MAVELGAKLAEIDNSRTWDSNVTVKEVHGQFDNLNDAIDEMYQIAARPDVDGAIVADGAIDADGTIADDGLYRVVATEELSTLCTPGRSNSLHEGVRHVIGLAAGSAAAGVSLRGSSDGSFLLDRVQQSLELAGMPPQDARLMLRAGLSPQRAHTIANNLLTQPVGWSGYGARAMVLDVLAVAMEDGISISPGTLVEMFNDYKDLVVLRPDGRLVNVQTGRSVVRVGDMEVEEGGALRAGPFEMGQFYRNYGGVFSSVDESLDPQALLWERGIEPLLTGVSGADRIIEGVASGLGAAIVGLGGFIAHPIRSIESLGKLPDTIAHVLRNSPEYWDYFTTLTLGEQTRVASEIATNIALLAGGVTATARAGSAAASWAGRAGGLSIVAPEFAMTANGTMIAQMSIVEVIPATVAAAAAETLAVTATGAGIGYAMSSTLPNPEKIARNRRRWGEHYGPDSRVGGAGNGSPSSGKPGSSPPELPPLPDELSGVTKPKGIAAWLERNGFTLQRSRGRGSHRKYIGPSGRHVSLSGHNNAQLPRGTLSNIRNQIRRALIIDS